MQDFLVPAHDRGASRQSAAGRALARPAAMRRSGLRSGRAVPDAALAAAVGASHRLPCAARLGVVRRNSLRSLRELRSDRAPQVRSTKRASRADPEAALLGAADIGAPKAAPPARASRPMPHSPLGPGPPRCRVPLSQPQWCPERRRGRCPQTPQRLLQRRGPPAVSVPVRSREAQQHRRRAQRASSIILAATVRAELAQRAQRVSPRQPVLRASQGTPA